MEKELKQLEIFENVSIETKNFQICFLVYEFKIKDLMSALHFPQPDCDIYSRTVSAHASGTGGTTL